jgi:hypothetical protein
MKMFQAALAAALLAATGLHAEPLAIHATAKAADKSKFFPTGSTGGVLNFLIEFEPLKAAAADDPLTGAAGPCFGLGKSNNGLTAGEGYCSFTDGTGENLMIHWYMEPAAEVHGSWQFVGGTGRWGQAMGGGFFFDTKSDDGAITTHFDGQVEFH